MQIMHEAAQSALRWSIGIAQSEDNERFFSRTARLFMEAYKPLQCTPRSPEITCVTILMIKVDYSAFSILAVTQITTNCPASSDYTSSL